MKRDETGLRWLFLVAALGMVAGIATAVNEWIVPAARHFILESEDRYSGDIPLVDTGRLGALTLLVGIAFLVWLYRARSNLDDFYPHVQPSFSMGWILGAWIIPAANLVMPALVIGEVAAKSVHPDRDRPSRGGLIALVTAWWLCFAGRFVTSVMVFVIDFEARMGDAYPTVNLTRGEDYWVLIAVSGVLTVIAGVLAVLMMWRVQKAQVGRYTASMREPDPADFPTFTVDKLLPAGENA